MTTTGLHDVGVQNLGIICCEQKDEKKRYFVGHDSCVYMKKGLTIPAGNYKK